MKNHKALTQMYAYISFDTDQFLGFNRVKQKVEICFILKQIQSKKKKILEFLK